MGARHLPVAPRPFRDETLSSWLGRIACRYGLDASALAACLAAPDDPFDAPPPPIDDISPSVGQIALWARAAAVDPARLRRMTLAERHPRRPLAWFLNRGLAATRPVMPRPSSPVCVACFDADRAAGHDGYCRASWRLPERCVCPAHGRMLIDQCPNCHGRLLVEFRLRENRARPICARCESALEGRGGEGEGLLRDMATALLAMQARIAAAVDHAPIDRSRLEEIVGALWSPLDDPGASRPVLALWVSERGWRAPVEARLAVGQPMPLGAVAGSRSRPDPRRHSRPLRPGGHGAGRGAGAGRLAISARRASASRPRQVPLPTGALAGWGAALARRLSPSGA
jgi:TniQ